MPLDFGERMPLPIEPLLTSVSVNVLVRVCVRMLCTSPVMYSSQGS